MKWIETNKLAPEFEKLVLGYTDSKKIVIVKCIEKRSRKNGDQYYWEYAEGEDCYCCVTHWMELPSAPEM